MVARARWIISLLALACVACVARPWPAAAHSLPERFEPGRDAVLRSAPVEVRIRFGGDLEPAFSTLQVSDSAGRRVDKGDVRVDERTRRLLRVSVGALGPGAYRVVWQILAIDGHRAQGTYMFTIMASE